MSDFIEIKSYTIKKSKTGLSVPVINDVHLHSIYDPIREAASVINHHKQQLDKSDNVLVLGLGYGYHIDEIIKYFKESNRIPKICVIEPNADVVKDCFKERSLDSNNIKIFSYKSVETLFNSKNLADFLIRKPTIIAHAPSFNLYKHYYTKYLTYKASQNILKTRELLNNEKFIRYLSTFDNQNSLTTITNQLFKNNRMIKQREDFALMAFDKISDQLKIQAQ